LSGLLLAAGIAGKSGRVGMIDAENRRGKLYADDPLPLEAFPEGYEYDELRAPFTPRAYISKLQEAERAGITVCLIDSGSHEWEGDGGCQDIAEEKKLKGMPNWALAKREHKRLMQFALSTQMHLIWCLRARDKVKIEKDSTGKEQIVPLGIQPIAEKNFVYEMLLSLGFEEKTHFAYGIKVPGMLAPFFPGNELITKSHGERIAKWNESGRAEDKFEMLKRRASVVVVDGTDAYRAFFLTLTAEQKHALQSSGMHDELKAQAAEYDKTGESDPDAPAGDGFALEGK
jgi:hypothetical protein